MEEITLEIIIPYRLQNDIFLPLIKKIGKRNQVKGFVEKKEKEIRIIVKSDEEKLKNFMDDLGRNLPLSIFMDIAQINPCNENLDINEFYIKNKAINILPVNYGLCPSCNQEVVSSKDRRYLYPFISCNYCGPQYSYLFYYPFERDNTIYRYFHMCKNCQKEYENEYSFRYKYPLTSCYECFIPIFLYKDKEEILSLGSKTNLSIYIFLAEKIKNNEEIIIKTLNGYKVISKTYQNESYILVTNPDKLEDIAYLSEKELRLLASIEKPTVKVVLKEKFKEDENIKLSFGYIKYPDDGILISLCEILKNLGTDFVFVKNIPYPIGNIDLDFDIKIENPQKELKVTIVQGKTLILEGEKGIFPTLLKVYKSTQKITKYKNLGCIQIGKGEYLIDKIDKILNFKKENLPLIDLEHIEPYKLSLMSVIAENNLFQESAVCLYLSKSFESIIALKKHDIKPLIRVLPLKAGKEETQTISNVLSEISSISPEYNKLVNKFVEKFNIKKSESEEKNKLVYGLEPIFNTIGKILGISDEKFKTLDLIESYALDFHISRGLIVDFSLKEENGQFYIDWQKALASLMAYKLAGDSKEILSFSLLESFSEFLENQINIISKKFNIKNVIISGDFFTNTVVAGRVLKHFKNYNVFTNIILPFSEENFVLGGMFID
ncbi:acylphosphatase [Sulfurihydrogenibium sp.]|uniref:acylphosphatase n=1 Tax=Sulfurihydrogenibium sp. TaxID=2053621 RepID=UPI0026240255|nr:acylphosphatase [Sulfurihydrogenibium sp.]